MRLLAFITAALVCVGCHAPRTGLKHDTGSNTGADAGHKMALVNTQPSFPCNDAALATDPNNCGACQRSCGTFGPNAQGGASFIQGTCALNECTPYVESTVDLDCWDWTPPGAVVGRVNGTRLCQSVLSSPQNCGGLGWICSGPCQDGRCSGPLSIPPALAIQGLSTIVMGNATTYTATGGRLTDGGGSYTFGFATSGNNTGNSTIGSGGHYTAGTYDGGGPIVDVIKVFDDVGNATIFSITVTAS